jgi:hypothetical protein
MDEELFYGLDDDEIENKYQYHTQRNNLNLKGPKKDFESKRRNSKDDSNLNMKSIGLLNQANNNIYSEEIKEIEEQKNKENHKNIDINIQSLDNVNNNNNISLKGKFYDEAYDKNERNALPAIRKKINLNVWGILKEAVTKDLSKFCVPGI